MVPVCVFSAGEKLTYDITVSACIWCRLGFAGSVRQSVTVVICHPRCVEARHGAYTLLGSDMMGQRKGNELEGGLKNSGFFFGFSQLLVLRRCMCVRNNTKSVAHLQIL